MYVAGKANLRRGPGESGGERGEAVMVAVAMRARVKEVVIVVVAVRGVVYSSSSRECSSRIGLILVVDQQDHTMMSGQPMLSGLHLCSNKVG